MLRDARKAVLDPLEASGDDVGLFDSLPEPGTIVSEQTLPDNITRLTLSNGATVLLKPTTYDKDAISFIAWSKEATQACRWIGRRLHHSPPP
ncbi:hypothetical protein MASR2M48_18280 [Spirochaetota bacterium]